MSKVHTDLLELRKSIDLLDQAIVCLLSERMRIVKKVGLFKKANSIPPLDTTRWEAVLQSKRELAALHGLEPDLIENILNQIHKQALVIESTL